MSDQSNTQEQFAEKKGHATTRSYLPVLEQEQLWIYNKQEKLAIAEALGFSIHELEKRIFLAKRELDEITTLTRILNRLGYDVREKKTGEWTKTKGKSELFYRKEQDA